MKYIVSVLVLIYLCNTNLFSQERHPADLLVKHNIKEVEAYIFENMEAPDSMLITKAYFNKKGNRTKIEIYDSLSMIGYYEYIFKHDTLYTRRNTYDSKVLISSDRFVNNEYGKMIEAIQYGKDGMKTGFRSIYEYNKNQDLLKSKTYYHNGLIKNTKKWYYPSGELKKERVLLPKKAVSKTTFHKNGDVKSQKSKNIFKKQEFQNYNDTGKPMIRHTMIKSYDTRHLGITGWRDLKKGDELITEKYFLKNDLLDHETQFLNGKLLGVKRYKYIPQ